MPGNHFPLYFCAPQARDLMKLLIVEDEKGLSDAIGEYLSKAGYLCEMALAYEEAVQKISLFRYDCAIIDINLPGGSGFDLIRQIRDNRSDTGIIIISARNALDDRINGLNIGADDYLVKPFHLSELNARVRSVIRRMSFGGSNEILFHEIKVIPDDRLVFVNENPVTLTRKEFDLLLFFLSNKDRVIGKESIAEHLWGEEMDMADSFDFIYTHIKNLRKKLMEKGGQDYITTVYGIGYKFTANL
jgi:DNA-binding response OmpR family regulator